MKRASIGLRWWVPRSVSRQVAVLYLLVQVHTKGCLSAHFCLPDLSGSNKVLLILVSTNFHVVQLPDISGSSQRVLAALTSPQFAKKIPRLAIFSLSTLVKLLQVINFRAFDPHFRRNGRSLGCLGQPLGQKVGASTNSRATRQRLSDTSGARISLVRTCMQAVTNRVGKEYQGCKSL